MPGLSSRQRIIAGGRCTVIRANPEPTGRRCEFRLPINGEVVDNLTHSKIRAFRKSKFFSNTFQRLGMKNAISQPP